MTDVWGFSSCSLLVMCIWLGLGLAGLWEIWKALGKEGRRQVNHQHAKCGKKPRSLFFLVAQLHSPFTHERPYKPNGATILAIGCHSISFAGTFCFKQYKLNMFCTCETEERQEGRCAACLIYLLLIITQAVESAIWNPTTILRPLAEQSTG